MSITQKITKWLKKLISYSAYLCLCFIYGAQSALAEQMITTTGYTQTHLNIQANVTDISTKTIVGKNAFNSFSKFNVNQGKTVNLQVPNSAQNLLNIVHDKRSNINGTLNAYKNGQIGGNVYFANPHGLVVGKSGSVNVGRLTVTTPTQGFVDGFFDGTGTPSAIATQQLINGTAPLNSNAIVDIKGHVNVQQSAQIRAGYVDIAGELNNLPTTRFVNLNGQQSANNIKEENGEITLYASNDINITGDLHADGADNINAGRVDVRSGGDIHLAENAQLTAKGNGNNSDGGTVSVFAGKDASINDNATLDASSTGTGDAGFVEFSAKKTVDLAGGNLLASAEDGQAGTVLIDPENLTIGADLLRGNAQGTGSGINWNSGNLSLQADNKITVNDNIVISTRSVAVNGGQSGRDAHINNNSTADSGDLTLQAVDIEVGNDAKLLTFSDGSFNAGNITLEATGNDLFSQNALINIFNGAEIRAEAVDGSAGDILLKTTARAALLNALTPFVDAQALKTGIAINSVKMRGDKISIISDADGSSFLDDNAGGTAVGESILDFLGSVNPLAAVVLSNATSELTLNNADIDATGDMTLSSTAATDARSFTPSTVFGMVYAESNPDASISIENGTILNATNNININTHADSTLATSAIVLGSTADAAFVYTKSDIKSILDIDSSSNIAAGGTADIKATMTKSHRASASAITVPGGAISLAATIGVSNSDTAVNVDGTVTAADRISIESTSTTERNDTEASASNGSVLPFGATLAKLAGNTPLIAPLLAYLTAARPLTGTPAKFAGAFSLADYTNKATATVGSNATLTTTGANSAGDINVLATIKDSVQTAADASASALDPKTTALTAGVTVGTFNNNANAMIANNAEVDAAKALNVDSLVSLPYEITWHQINSTTDVFDKVNGNLGIQNGFFTTWAGALGTSPTAAIGGTVNVSEFNTTSHASIDNGALINQNNGNSGLARDVSVDARSLVQSLNFSGSASLGTAGGGGAAYLDVSYNTDTQADIAGDVKLAADSLAVKAETGVKDISIAIAGGAGATGVGGSTSVATTNNDTRALIDNNAFIVLGNGSAKVSRFDPGTDGGLSPDEPWFLDTNNDGNINSSDDHVTSAPSAQGNDYLTDLSLAVAAEDESDIYNITGGLGGGYAGAVGLTSSVNNITRNTEASIADTDNSADTNGSVVTTGNAFIAAHNKGDIYAYSAAVAGSAGFAGGGVLAHNNIDSNALGYIDNTNISGFSPTTPTFKSNNIDLISYDDSYIEAALAASVSGSVGVGASVAINKINNDISASMTNVETDDIDNNTSIKAIDSGKVFATVVASSEETALGGAGSAIAVNRINNSIDAYLTGGKTNYHVKNISIEATSDKDITNISVARADSGGVGVGGSVSSNYINNTINSYIDDGATVIVEDNIAILSTSDDRIKSSAGSLGVGLAGAGVGASLAINEISGDTQAYIDGTSTHVTALAKDETDTLEVNSGKLDSGVSLANQVDIDKYHALDLKSKRQTKTITGLGVNAASSQHIEVVGVNVGVGTLGVGLIEDINNISGNTKAYVSGATINGSLAGSGSTQQVDINASNHAYINSFVGNVTAGQAGVGVAEDLATVSRTVQAYAASSTLKARDAINVNALATQGISSLAAGGSGGIAGAFAGTGVLAQFQSYTEASLTNVDIEANSVNVHADSDDDRYLVAGAAAVSGGGAVGGSFTVGLNNSTTKAYIKGENQRSKLAVQNAVDVSATTNSDITNYSISAAGAGGVGVAGSVVTNIETNTTEAEIVKTDIGSNGARAGDITVAANNTVDILNRAGAGGGGVAGGVGAGAVVNILKSRTIANTQDSDIYSQGLVDIAANSENKVDSLAVMVGLGGTAGIGGAASVTLVGDNLTSESGDEVDKGDDGTLTKVNDFTNKDRFAELQGSDNNVITADEKSRLNSGAQGDVKDIANGNDAARLQYQTAATIGTNVNIDAASVQVNAKDLTTIKSIVGTVGAGTVGIGGAVTVASVKSNINALVDESSTVATTGDLTVSALADNEGDKTVDTNALAGSAGVVGLGAAVSIASIDNAVNAGLAGTVNSGLGKVTVKAEDKSQISAKALGAQAGALAIGAVVSRADKSSDINTSISDSVTAANIDVIANSSGSLYAESQAAAGGIISGSGADARANDKTQVSAVTASGTQLNAVGGTIKIDANATPDVEAIAYGSSLAYGLNVGVSNAFAKADTSVDAYVADNNTITADVLTVSAGLSRLVNTDSVRAKAWGAGGGLLIGIGATNADASNLSDIGSYIGNNSSLTITGRTAVSATIDSKQYAKADGYNGGVLALGFNDAQASSDTRSTAFLGTNVKVAGGDLSVLSDGSDNNYAESVSGGGGVVGGSSSKASTDSRSDTQAYISNSSAGRTLDVNALSVKANHTASFNSSVNSSFGAAIGASGAYTNNDQYSTVTANVGDNVDVTARNIDINAINLVRKDWLSGNKSNVVSGSGGVIDAPAGKSISDINLITKATVGNNSQLIVEGDPLNPGELTVSALNDVLAKDKAKLDSGGVLPIALAESKITNDVNDATVQISNSELRSVGDINLTTRIKTDIQAKANVKTYGLASAASGTTLARVDANNKVRVKSGAYLRAEGNLKVLAGQDKTGSANHFDVVARTDLWNKTAIPFISNPKADAKLTQNSTVDIENGAELGSVKDTYLLADEGSVFVEGKGIGKDAYREALAALASGVSKLFGGDDVSFDIHGGSKSTSSHSSVVNNGIVKAGIQNKQYLTIRTDGTVDKNDPQGQSDGVTFTETHENLSNNIDAKIAAYEQLKIDFSDLTDVVAAYQNEIDRLNAQKAQLAGLDTNVDYINVGGIFAQSSNIHIKGDNLTGTGQFDAPGDTLIQVKNHSAKFLRTDWLMIPENSGGRITFNDIQIHDNSEINARNQSGSASFNSVVTSKNSATPLIHVENTYRPGSGGNPAGIEPDIEIAGDITNLRGTVKVANEAGSVNVAGNILANTIDIQAGKDLVLSYIDGFRHLGGDPKSHWASVASASESAKVDRVVNGIHSGGSTLIAGNNIFASAKILNINGLIQSGLPDNFITLDSAPQIYEDFNNSSAVFNSLAWARNDYLTKVGLGQNPSKYYRIKASTGDTIDASYNAALDRIELQDVKVQGGYMQLFGQIISTGAGELRVLDGYGRIDVTNNSTKDLMLNQLDVGVEREGQIKITDTNFRGVNNQPLTTWYRRLGNQVSVWDSATIDGGGNPNHLVRYETAGQKKTHYSPKSGQYFSWLKRETKTTTKKKTDYKLTCFYITDCSNDSSTSNGPTTYSAPEFVRDDLVLNYQNKNDDYWYDVTHLQSNSGWYRDNSKGGGDGYTKHVTSTDFGFGTVEWYKKEWWYYEKKIYDTWYHQHNVNAFHNIDINFIGSDTSQLNVTSQGNILINGGLRNNTGLTSLSTQGSIEQLTTNASISGHDINLLAVNGIGNNSTVKTNLNGGLLSATTANGNINLEEVLGDLNYSNLLANNGDVTITVDGDLMRGNNSALIRGDAINLTSNYGQLGSSANRIIIDSGENLANADGLTAQAAGDIYLTEQSGDLLAVSADAKGGDVDLAVPTGDLIDANLNETRDTRTEAELLALWNDMLLVGTTGVDEKNYAAKTIQGFENSKTSEYRLYWQYRVKQADPSVYDPSFSVVSSAAEVEALTQQGWTGAQIMAFDQQRTEQYHAYNLEYAGLGDTYNASYNYQATSSDIAELSQGSVWTENQLKFALGGGLLKEASDTKVRIEEANISGVNVKLNVANAVGRTLNDIVIDNTPAVLTLTDNDRIALASAEVGDLNISDTEIRIKQRDDINVDATDSLNVVAGQDIFIGSEKDIKLDHITSTSAGSVIIKGGQGIYNVATDSNVNIDAGNLILEAAQGSIGTKLVSVSYSSPGTLTARSGQDIYLKNSGDMLVSTLFARNHIQLEANSIVDALDTDNINIRSKSLDLIASDSIGQSDNALDVALDADGLLTALAGVGGLYINAPDRDLNLGLIETAGDVDIKAKGDITNGTANELPMLKGNNFMLSSLTGQVGSQGKAIIGDSNGTVDINATTGIYYQEQNGDLVSQSLITDTGPININVASGNGDLGNVATMGDVNLGVSGGLLNIDSVNAGTASFMVAEESGELIIADLKVKDRLFVTADNINLPMVQHTGTVDKLLLNLSGNDGGIADEINIGLNSSVGSFYEKLSTKNVSLSSNSGNLQLSNFTVSGFAEIKMPDYSIVIYDGPPKLFPEADIQLVGGEPINLAISSGSKLIFTNAMIVDYQPDYILNSFSTDNSLSLIGEKRTAQQTGTNGGLMGEDLYQSLWGTDNPFNAFFDRTQSGTIIYDPELLVQTESENNTF